MVYCVYCTRPWALRALGSHAVKYTNGIGSEVNICNGTSGCVGHGVAYPYRTSNSLFLNVPTKSAKVE